MPDARARLGALVPGAADLPPSAGPLPPQRRTPASPPDEPGGAEPTGPDTGDEADLLARWRSEALRSAARAYTAAHGHPLDHEEPTEGRRWALARTPAIAVGAALLVLAGLVLARGLLGAGTTVPLDVPVPEEEPVTATVLVHVVGEVAEPGLVELPAGARVAEAVEAAGGASRKADLAALNLARPVEDGEQVHVPRRGEQAGAAPTAADPRLDLNSADAASLEALPGIGPVLAERILAWRAEHGRFRSVEELQEVAGIGPKLFAQLAPLVRV